MLAPAIFRLLTLSLPTRHDVAVCILGFCGRTVFNTALFNHSDDPVAIAYREGAKVASSAKNMVEEWGVDTDALWDIASQASKFFLGSKLPSQQQVQKETLNGAMSKFTPSKEYEKIDLNGFHLF